MAELVGVLEKVKSDQFISAIFNAYYNLTQAKLAGQSCPAHRTLISSPRASKTSDPDFVQYTAIFGKYDRAMRLF